MLRCTGACACLAALAAAPAAPAVAGSAAAARPVLLAAGPRVVPSDRPGGGFARVTFSPDGDGRHDRVWIRVRAHAGAPLLLRVHPVAALGDFVLPAGSARSRVSSVAWNGRDPRGRVEPAGSYVLEVCSPTPSSCSRLRVLAHLRILSIYARVDRGVSVGQAIPVRISTDRAGPYLLELAPAATLKDAPRPVGIERVRRAGWIRYRVPRVPYGGLWVLTVRSGAYVDHFPLVVHQPRMLLAYPPPGTALVVYPYLTWRAYDTADENRDGRPDSWYAHPRDPVVPLYGPFESTIRIARLLGRETNAGAQNAFADWMLEHRLVAEHVTDLELAAIPRRVLARYAAVVFEGHTEYYEDSTYDKLLAYRNAGGHLYFLQGNSFYGEVRVGTRTVTRLTYRHRTAARSDFALAATGYQTCCWPRSIRPFYTLRPGVAKRLPWLLAGTGLRDGDQFGLALHEVDTISPALSPPGTIAVATATVPAYKPASSYEAVEAWVGTHPIPFQQPWLRPRTLAVAYARTGRGAVFSWGNNGFMESLFSASDGLPARERAALDRVALNVWERFTRSRTARVPAGR